MTVYGIPAAPSSNDPPMRHVRDCTCGGTALAACLYDITESLLRSQALPDVETLICDQARTLAHASRAVIARPGSRGCAVTAVATGTSDAIVGAPVTSPWCTRHETSPQPIVEVGSDMMQAVMREAVGPSVTAALAMPPSCGFLFVARAPGEPAFDGDTVACVGTLARQASIAIEYRLQIETLASMRERQYLARDLHDLALQEILGASMNLESAAKRTPADAEIGVSLQQALDGLDIAIEELRTTLGAREPAMSRVESLVAYLRRLIAVLTDGHEVHTTVEIDEAINLLPGQHRRHVVAAVHESVSNAMRHASCRHLDVRVEIDDDVVLTVADDGVGCDATTPSFGRGLGNLASRADELGGVSAAYNRPGGGFLVEWRVPVGASKP